MDDATKIIIGTLSGFIIAFFAEPVRLVFQNNSKKKYFQLALYSEIYSNYRFLSTFLKVYGEDNPNQMKAFFDGGIKHAVRTDCYVHFVSHYPDIYYQLSEATFINNLYAYLTMASNPELYSDNNISAFHLAVESFVELVEDHIM